MRLSHKYYEKLVPVLVDMKGPYMLQTNTRIYLKTKNNKELLSKIRKAKSVHDLTAVCRYGTVLDKSTIITIINKLKNIIKVTKKVNQKAFIQQARLLIKTLLKYSEESALPFDYKDLSTIQNILELLKIRNLKLDAQFIVSQNKHYNYYSNLPKESELIFSFQLSNN